MKILLIEDDREAASYLIQALDEAGHITHHASDGETGYAMASGMDYDVLIVDRMLPRRDGLSIVESLRAEADRTTMGVSWFGPSPARIARVAVRPSITGMFTSMMIRSKRCSPAASTAI